jgi:hypothetical protein
LEASTPGQPSGAIIFRANSSLSASGGAFAGDWLEAGATRVQAHFRHDFDEKPVQYFLRLAPSAGGAEIFFADREAPADQWTLLNFEISAANWQSGGAAFFGQQLGNIANFQIGALLERPITNTSAEIFFELDEVSIVPEPAMAFMAIGSAIGVLVLRRRCSQ